MLRYSALIFLVLILRRFSSCINATSELEKDMIFEGFNASANYTYDLTNERIVGGQQVTNIRNFPYQVSILSDGICGGTLVRYNWVVTAAHCTAGKRPSAFTVRAGSISYFRGGAVARVVKVKNHPKYQKSNYNYDISLLKLKTGYTKNLQKRFGIRPIKMAKRFPSALKVVLATGFGATSPFGGELVSLRKILMRIIRKRSCNRSYRRRLTKSMQCAGSVVGGRGTCQGDAGGPLVRRGRLVGVTSWGLFCGFRPFPGVFTNVPLVRNWANGVMNRN